MPAASAAAARPIPQEFLPRGRAGWVVARLMRVGHGPAYARMAAVAAATTTDDLLDVGCGGGQFLRRHAWHVPFVAGIDLSDVQVRLARRALQDRLTAGTADVVKGNATSMPWPDGRFSLVTCLWGIEVFAHPQGVLREIRRVLRPGGRAVLSAGVVIRSEGARARLAKSFPTAHFDWTEDDVRSMIVAAGFEEPDFTDADLGSPVLNRVNQLMTGFDTFRIAGARVPVG